MPITHSDRISGSIFILAESAEDAGDQALKYLQDKDFDHRSNYGVFDDRPSAEKELFDHRSSYDPARVRIYVFKLDIQVADHPQAYTADEELDPDRAMSVVADLGYFVADKKARHVIQDLVKKGLLTRTQDLPIQHQATGD